MRTAVARMGDAQRRESVARIFAEFEEDLKIIDATENKT